MPSRQLPHEPGIDRSEQDFPVFRKGLEGDVFSEEPGQLGTRKIWIEPEAGTFAEFFLETCSDQFLANGSRPPALPDNRLVHRFAAVPVPHDDRFPLVCYADRDNFLRTDSRLRYGLTGHGKLGFPNFVRIMLNPSRCRIILRKRFLGLCHKSAVMVKQNGSRRGCSLIKRKNISLLIVFHTLL